MKDDWAPVRVVGMVEGYRERIFKDSGGKMAFFELEDLTGRVSVKLRANQIEAFAASLTSGEPVLVTGKVSFPRRDEDDPEPDDGPREATIMPNEIVSLAEAVRKDTKGVVIRLRADKVDIKQIDRLVDVMKNAPREAAVTAHVTIHVVLNDGAEAVIALGKEHRVEVGDAFLAGLEKIFGEQVAELR